MVNVQQPSGETALQGTVELAIGSSCISITGVVSHLNLAQFDEKGNLEVAFSGLIWGVQ